MPTALYCFTDDLLTTRRPGAAEDPATPLRHVHYLRRQSGWNEQLRAAGPLIARLIRTLAELTLTAPTSYG